MIERSLNLSRGQANEERFIVGLDLGLVGGAVAVDLAAARALVNDDKALFGIGLGANGLHLSAAFAGTVAGVDVHVERPEAEGTVVARGVAKGLYGLSAVLANKSVIVFGESFLFHYSRSLL